MFVDQATEPVPAQNAHTGRFGWRARTPSGRVVPQRPVRPARVVMVGMFALDQPRVPFAGDRHPARALAAGAGHPGDRVRSGRAGVLIDRHTGRSDVRWQ